MVVLDSGATLPSLHQSFPLHPAPTCIPFAHLVRPAAILARGAGSCVCAPPLLQWMAASHACEPSSGEAAGNFAPTCTPVMGGRHHLVTVTMLLQGMQSLYEHIIRTSPVGDISDQTLQVNLPEGHVSLW